MTPNYDDVLRAATRIDGQAIKTPLLTSDILDERLNARVFLKAENLQRTGSFKFRGAMNAISALMSGEVDGGSVQKKGVVACSSGNHAQGIAEAARLHRVVATIIMPSDAPAIKVERTRRSGAKVVLYDRDTEEREAVTEAYIERHGGCLVHPYDNPHVIAGQGTCALEAADWFEEAGLSVDAVFPCTGGGGLAAGIATVMKERFPGASFYTVEPEGFDDYRRSLELGARVVNNRLSGSVCDAILTPSPGEISFSVLNGYASGGCVITDEEALDAVAFAFHELKMVVEPGGAAALACLLNEKVNVEGKVVLATLSGGNIDPKMMAKALRSNPVSSESEKTGRRE